MTAASWRGWRLMPGRRIHFRWSEGRSADQTGGGGMVSFAATGEAMKAPS